MKHFIDSAQEYISNTFDDLQQVEIIVPNNRTGAALLSSLKKNANKVCWAPKITPIKEIFARNTKLHDFLASRKSSPPIGSGLASAPPGFKL